MIKKLFAILTCKILHIVLKLFGKGSSMPGKIALKIDKNILNEVVYPKYIIAVTGSNGKTSTVEMINKVLTDAGYKVAYNKEGSNQIEGVATFILANVNLKGVFKKEIVLLETDERYARLTFKHFKPTHYVITNIYRDQMTRNGHHEWIRDIIKDSIKDESIIILNSDDPTVSSLNEGINNQIYYFGMSENMYSTKNNTSVYDDGYYCPICKNKMEYEYYHFNHIGSYHCPSCGFKRNEPNYAITNVDLNKGQLVLDGEYHIDLAYKSIYNAYNILATYAVTRLLNVEPSVIVKAMNNYLIKNGRRVEFTLGDKNGLLVISKHENSISYNQSLRVVKNHQGDTTVLIMVDAISRKYFTSETSWLWDIDFEYLNADNIKMIVLTGQYASDLAERIMYAGVDFNKVHIDKDIKSATSYLENNAVGYIYTLTCFSDEKKYMSLVEVKK